MFNTALAVPLQIHLSASSVFLTIIYSPLVHVLSTVPIIHMLRLVDALIVPLLVHLAHLLNALLVSMLIIFIMAFVIQLALLLLSLVRICASLIPASTIIQHRPLAVWLALLHICWL